MSKMLNDVANKIFGRSNVSLDVCKDEEMISSLKREVFGNADYTFFVQDTVYPIEGMGFQIFRR